MHCYQVLALLTISTYASIPTCAAILRCAMDNKPKPVEYYFVAACTRSIMKLISLRYYDSLAKCKQYAVRRKAFALNFVHKELLHSAASNYSGGTCLVYDCPEFDADTSLDRSHVYDYYSAYARPMPNTNVSCIPKLGVFQLHKVRENYTNAIDRCYEEGGTLADITTRYHTEQLSSLMATEQIAEAYVGLDRIEYPPEFLNSRGLPLSCLDYRAWAPGEPKPKKNANCVVLTSKKHWKISTCERELPFICELKPNGPYRPCRRFYSQRRRVKCRKQFSASMPSPKRNPKCGDPAILEFFEEKRNKLSKSFGNNK